MRRKKTATVVMSLLAMTALPATANAGESTYWNTVVALHCWNTDGYNGQMSHLVEKSKGNVAQGRYESDIRIGSNIGYGWRVGFKYQDGQQAYTAVAGTGHKIHLNDYTNAYSNPFIQNRTGGSASAAGCYFYN